MRCGELAKRMGVSPDTIRHYERLGLLKVPPRTAGGFREYPPDSIDRVRLIRRALGAGFSLRELASILQVRDRGGIPCHGVLTAAVEKLKHIDSQINELKAARRQLASILKDWKARLAKTKREQPARLLENLPKRMEEQAHAIHSPSRNLAHRRGLRAAATE